MKRRQKSTLSLGSPMVGKEFVLGCSNGYVYKVDITYHTPIISPCWIPESRQSAAPILSLTWVNYEFKKKQMDIDGFDINAFDLESALPKLSQEPPEEPLLIKLPVNPLQQNEVQTLLFTSNSRGQIQIILNGIYPIGSVGLGTEANLEAIEISAAQNASSLQIITKPESKAPPSPSAEFISYTLNTQILDDRKEEIHSVSEIQTKLNYLLEYTQCTLDVVRRHHVAFTGFTRKIANQASYYITHHNENTSAMPEVELFATLATGNVTESLQEFFTEFLSSQRIKQWETNVKHGHHNSLVIICEHILPACERIQLELGKLLGYSLWTQRYGDFLRTLAVEKCIAKARQLVSETFQYSKSLGVMIKSFEAFLTWISVVSLKVYDPDSMEVEQQSGVCEEPELVASFLDKDFVRDSLDVYFNEKDKNLIYLLSELSDCCTEMLKKPSETISAKIQVISMSRARLPGVSIQAQPRKTMISFTGMENGVQTIFYAMLLPEEAQLVILKKRFDDSILKYAAYKLDGNITDFEFFDEKELGVLTQIDQGTTILQAISLTDSDFRTLNSSSSSSEIEISNSPNVRSLELPKMIHVKLGCNGLPRRRILCVAASNGLLKIYFMDKTDDEEDEEEEE
ncbi:hypothetical protein [Parasitella parasitica]|uniref:Anaphase-promoting complex subunit 4 n=1 Tax=Parasitella parasitica TaxID=35722 RepID=A0A0B7MMU9_9FUNG|nr:hypothetical protein [Parasitella parasitica]